MLLSIGLVILVVFVFFRDVRSAMIASVVVPASLVGTFGAMYLLGYMNNLSLMALTIATGFVVDDAIVVIENIMRHLEQGTPPRQAALRGAKEIGFTVVSITLSLLAVFIPILLMRGLFGRLFQEFAVTLSVAVGMSLVVSLTTTPMMCAYLLRAYRGRTRLAVSRQRVGVPGHPPVVRDHARLVLRHQFLMLLVTLATIYVTVRLYIDIPKGFFPQQDTGALVGSIQADQRSSFQAVQQLLRQFVTLVHEDPAVANVVGITGGTFGGATNTARMFVRSNRSKSGRSPPTR